MNKKILIVVLILVVVVIGAIEIGVTMMNKGGNANNSQAQQSEQATQEEGFSFSYNGMDFEPGKEFSREKFGQELSYSEIESCAFEGLDKTYTYEHYEITSCPEAGKENIYSIYFLDESVSTKEGVSLGDSYDKMIQTYSDNFKNQDNQYTYSKGKTSIDFIVENGVITSIQYNYVV